MNEKKNWFWCILNRIYCFSNEISENLLMVYKNRWNANSDRDRNTKKGKVFHMKIGSYKLKIRVYGKNLCGFLLCIMGFRCETLQFQYATRFNKILIISLHDAKEWISHWDDKRKHIESIFMHNLYFIFLQKILALHWRANYDKGAFYLKKLNKKSTQIHIAIVLIEER